MSEEQEPLPEPESDSSSTIDFLMTWGWAIIILIVAIGVLFYFGAFIPKCGGVTVSEIKQIALNSECAQGSLKINSRDNCNMQTHTYWIDLDMGDQNQEGCNPACVVDVLSKNATINWRCTTGVNIDQIPQTEQNITPYWKR